MDGANPRADSGNEILAPVVILAGGQSRRMGTDKTRLRLGSGTLLNHIERQFAPIATVRIVVAGHGQPDPEVLAGTVVIHDERPILGPMEGIRAGLQHCQDLGFALAMLTTADAPLVSLDLYRYMVLELRKSESVECVVPHAGGTWHPLTAVWRTSLLGEVNSRLARGQLKVKELVAAARVLKLTEDQLKVYDPELRSLCNVNTPQDYERLISDTDSFHPR